MLSRFSGAVGSLPRKRYATCRRPPSHSGPIHRVIYPIHADLAALMATFSGGRLWQGAGHDQTEPQAIRCLARCDLGPRGQAGCIDAEVDLGREATPRTVETLSRSPPFTPAA